MQRIGKFVGVYLRPNVNANPTITLTNSYLNGLAFDLVCPTAIIPIASQWHQSS